MLKRLYHSIKECVVTKEYCWNKGEPTKKERDSIGKYRPFSLGGKKGPDIEVVPEGISTLLREYSYTSTPLLDIEAIPHLV